MVRVSSSFRLLVPSVRSWLVAFVLCLASSSWWLQGTDADCVACACQAAVCCFEVVEEGSAGLLIGNVNEHPTVQSFCGNSSSGCDEYQLVTDTESLFKLNSSTGEMTTSKPIDRESGILDTNDCFRDNVDVFVNADGGSSTRLVVSVRVLDINDNPPKFPLEDNTTQLTANVQETGPRSDLFCSNLLKAADADEGKNAQINFSVVGPNNDSFIAYLLDNQVCLENKVDIDFETEHFIVIVVQAEDNGTNPLTSSVSVNLTITDINDNVPVFLNASMVTLTVSETLPVGSEIAKFVAEDLDSGDFGEVSYEVSLQSMTTDLPFNVNGTSGVLYVSHKPEDRATPCDYQFGIDAVDGGGEHSAKPVTVCVIVILENNPPTFSFGIPPPQVNLTEGPQDNTTEIAAYFLRDPDSGQEITAFLDQNEYFYLDASFILVNFRFDLYVNVPSIDRETTPNISVTITFEDSGTPPRSTELDIIVMIEDINDNDPSLTRTNFSIEENTVAGIPLVDLTSYFTDPDYGANGSFGGAMLDSDLFTISDQRIQVKRTLDREKDGLDIVVIVVELFDAGSPVRSASQTLYITILDLNDNSPIFQEENLNPLFIIENEPNLQNITIVEAKDDDLGENGTVIYSLINTNLSLFHIDPISGQLSAMGDFDRETQECYHVTVVATDEGGGDLSTPSSIVLNITVNDTNDWSPEFDSDSRNTSLSVGASVPPNTLVGQVHATDRDTGTNAEIVYSLSGNGSEFFKINETGQIVTSMDFEDVMPTTMELSVAANNTYQQNMSDVTTVTITIKSDPETTGMTLYIILGVAVLFIILAFVALIVVIFTVYYCRTHTKKRTLNKTSSNHVIPRRSSLRPTPSAGKDNNNVTVNSINGAGTFSRSPTVNFRPDSEVAYYNREQAITKSEFETHKVPVQHGEEKGSDKDIDCPQIPTKESPSQAKHIVPNPRLSDDLSSSSTASNPPEYSPFYSQHTSQHATLHQTMVLSEDALKEHNRVYSEGGGMLSDSTARYLATVEEPMDRDDGSTYTDVTGGIQSVIRSYYPSHRSNQSLSVPVSQYVSQNGTLPSADSSPNLHYVPTHGSSSIPGVYYSNAREPISSHRRMMVMSDDALHDHLPPPSRYDSPIGTSSSRLLMPESNGMAAVRSIERYPSSSPETQAEEELVHATPLPPTHYPLHHYPIPHRTRSRDHLAPPHIRMNGSISHMDLVQYQPPRINYPPRGPLRQRSYHHPNIHSHPLPPPSHPMPEKGPPAPPYTSYHSFAASEDNSTMASSVLDQYLVFDHEPAVRHIDLTLSVDDIGLSSMDPESKRPPL